MKSLDSVLVQNTLIANVGERIERVRECEVREEVGYRDAPESINKSDRLTYLFILNFYI